MAKYVHKRAYGFDNALQALAPRPIIAQRAPTGSDIGYPYGQHWVDVPNDAEYTLTSISGGSAVWTTSPASGVGSFTSLTVNPGNAVVTAGDLTVSAGDLAVTSGNATLGGDLTVAGTATFNGDIDFSSNALIDLVSTLDAAPSILLHANGGTSEQIQLHSDQGTSLTSVYLLSDVGGIKVYAPGFANDAAIALQADAGGLDVDVALQLNLTSAEVAADAVSINSSNGGIDILSGSTTAGHDIDILSNASINLAAFEDVANAIYIRANAGTSETIKIHSDQGTGVASIDILSDVGGITLTSGLASADAINFAASAGGIDMDSALQLSLTSSQVSASALNFVASDAGGGMAFLAGTAGYLFTATAGDFVVASSIDSAQSIYLHANGGTSETIELHADQGTALSSIYLLSDVGGILLESTGKADVDAIKLNSVVGGVKVSALLDIEIVSGADVIISSINDAADAIYIHSDAGTSEAIRVHSDQGTGIGSIELESDAGGVRVTTAALAATTGLHVAQGAATAAIQVGAGVPSHNAPKGSLYLNTTGSSTSTRAYIATDASGTWTAITTAA